MPHKLRQLLFRLCVVHFQTDMHSVVNCEGKMVIAAVIKSRNFNEMPITQTTIGNICT
jgi:hypothetical protein